MLQQVLQEVLFLVVVKHINFKGYSWSANVGIETTTITAVYNMNNDYIAQAFGLDFGPLPFSVTIDFSHTTVDDSCEAVRNYKNSIKDKLRSFFYRIKESIVWPD